MQIDRTNYEIWFIDWLDGNLNKLQFEELSGFLDLNPDLKEEFDGLNLVSIKPAAGSFPHKEKLKKSPSDISRMQFEYLCAAYLEKDLSSSQENELLDIIHHDAQKKRNFELIQKTRLTSPVMVFRHKNLIRRRTALQKTMRLSFIGSSAAAAIILIIMLFFNAPHNPSIPLSNTAQNINADNNSVNDISEIKPVSIDASKSSEQANPKKRIKPFSQGKMIPVTKISAAPVTAMAEIPAEITGIHETAPLKVPVRTKINIEEKISSNELAASVIKLKASPVTDSRSNIGKFIAKTFREKILKEHTTTDSPLRVYEIAEAGVAGINKLLGWEMALDEKSDLNGNLKSVYFSSKILKFNAPVKKSEQLP